MATLTRTVTIPADGDRYTHVRGVENTAVGKELRPGKVRLPVGALVMRLCEGDHVRLGTVGTEGLVWVDDPIHRGDWFLEHLRAHVERGYAVRVVVQRAEELGKASGAQMAELVSFYAANSMREEEQAVQDELTRRHTETAVLRMTADL